MNRREFLITAAATTAAAAAPARPTLCVFSKHLPGTDYPTLAAKARDLGFEGIDLTVRPKGHVEPARVAEDLPKAVEAIRKAGLKVPMVTTDLKDVSDPAAHPTFVAMKQLGIPLYKIGYWNYNQKQPGVRAAVADAKRRFAGLVGLSSQFGLTAGLHNHSGAYVGAAMWEYAEILALAKPADAGYYFDPGHSVIEGGAFGWRVSLDVALERMKMSAIKDFYWGKTAGKWKTVWCPLGEGMVPWPEFFAGYAKAGYTGPLSLHSEYPGGEEPAQMKKDLEFLQAQVKAAYGA